MNQAASRHFIEHAGLERAWFYDGVHGLRTISGTPPLICTGMSRRIFVRPWASHDAELAEIRNTAPVPNLPAFARAIAKIAYCQAVLEFGLGGFRPLMLPDVILGRSPCIAFLVGGDMSEPAPPHASEFLHVIQHTNVTYGRLRFMTVRIRLFAHSGTPDHGMPVYEVVVGSEGSTRRVLRPVLDLPKVIPL